MACPKKIDLPRSIVKWFSALGAVALCSTYIGTAAPSLAAPKDNQGAEDLARQGIELRRAGRDAEAVSQFQRAYELAPTPRYAAQYGLCLLALSRWTEADLLLAKAVSAKDDPWIKKNRSTLKEASESAKSHIGRLEILGSPEGAQVSVNGRTVGTFPLAADLPVNEGSVDIEVAAPGFTGSTRNLSVRGASYQSVVVRLAPVVAIATVSEVNAPPRDSLQLTKQDGEAPRSITASPLFWTGIGVAAIAIGASIFLLSSGKTYPSADQRGTWEP